MLPDLTYFDAYLVIFGNYWYISLPLGLLLGSATIFAKSRGVVLRSLTFLGAVFFLIPMLWFALFTYGQKADQQEYHQNREAHSWVLKEPTTVAGIELAADTKIYFDTWFDMRNKKTASLDDISDLELSAPTQILEVIVNGNFHKFDRNYWRGTLQKDQVINGWPCSGMDTIEIEDDGELMTCTLSRTHKVFGRMIPQGTKVNIYTSLWQFDLPGDRYLHLNADTGEWIFDNDDTN